MAKKVAVLAVNPVNGFGLFQYLESFFENGISYRTFAVADTAEIMTNSGVKLTLDDVVANLIGKEDEYDALIFACGDAVPKFTENADKQYNKDLVQVMKAFNDKDKIMVGHCGAGLLYENFGLIQDRKIAVHPYVVPAIKKNVATDAKYSVDRGYYTAQTESAIWTMIPELLSALK